MPIHSLAYERPRTRLPKQSEKGLEHRSKGEFGHSTEIQWADLSVHLGVRQGYAAAPPSLFAQFRHKHRRMRPKRSVWAAQDPEGPWEALRRNRADTLASSVLNAPVL